MSARGIWAGDIGSEPFEIEFEPLEEPATVPEPITAPTPERVPVAVPG